VVTGMVLVKWDLEVSKGFNGDSSNFVTWPTFFLTSIALWQKLK